MRYDMDYVRGKLEAFKGLGLKSDWAAIQCPLAMGLTAGTLNREDILPYLEAGLKLIVESHAEPGLLPPYSKAILNEANWALQSISKGEEVTYGGIAI